MKEEDFLFWLGEDALETACVLESYEQLLREAEVFDLTDPQSDE